jgi:hypothetical protein
MHELVLFAVLSVMPAISNQDTAVVAPAPAPVLEAPQEQSLAAIPMPPEVKSQYPERHPICRVGLIVMIPDGREGRVTSRESGICRVLAYGEGYVSLWPEDIVEPVYPQQLPQHIFGH